MSNKKRLIKTIQNSGITNERILHAFRSVPREKFVPASHKHEAYADKALPIGEDQTISQPSLVAQMTALLKLKGDEKVLEIGTGSGYQAAILGELAKKVYSVEIKESLAEQAEQTLQDLGYNNVHVIHANGSIGYPEKAPYDAIIVTAGAENIPQPLVDQLKENGRLVIPSGKSLHSLQLKVGVKKSGELHVENIMPVAFVPLVGKHGRNS